MADVYSTVGVNAKKFVISQSDAGREIVVKVAKTNMTHDELYTIWSYLTTSHGVDGAGDSAFTVAAVGTADGSPFVSGTTDVVFFRLQGTGEYTVDGSDAHGVTGAVTTIEAVFKPAL
ncbi:MAG: hypothetical protein ABFD07_05250 [Methanobacterium sp.]